ncbi:MAG: helix-turn-helix domain-containing protein [Mycobacterium sp.]
MSTKALPAFVSIQESAEAAGMHPATIRRRIADGTLIAVRVGPRAIRIDRDSLLRMLSQPVGSP